MSYLPTIKVETLTTIHKDANHNAFTDLCSYSGKFYLTFRSSPDDHGISSSASVDVQVNKAPFGLSATALSAPQGPGRFLRIVCRSFDSQFGFVSCRPVSGSIRGNCRRPFRPPYPLQIGPDRVGTGQGGDDPQAPRHRPGSR